MQLIKPFFKVRKDRIIGIAAFFYIIIIVPKFLKQEEQHCKGVLRDGFR